MSSAPPKAAVLVAVIPDWEFIDDVYVPAYLYVVMLGWMPYAMADVYRQVGPSCFPANNAIWLCKFPDLPLVEVLRGRRPDWESIQREHVFDALHARTQLYLYRHEPGTVYRTDVVCYVRPWPRPRCNHTFVRYAVTDITHPY